MSDALRKAAEQALPAIEAAYNTRLHDGTRLVDSLGRAVFDLRQALAGLRAVERAARAAEREAMYKERGTLLFNPYSGRPRHPSDIESDPHGILLVDPERPLDGFSIEVKHG